MNSLHAITHRRRFVILGPTLARGNRVLEAIHSLYYLPEHYQMIFTGITPGDQAFYSEVKSFVKRNALENRVHFNDGAQTHDAVILPNATANQTSKQQKVTGDSPEALASAILNVARAQAY